MQHKGKGKNVGSKALIKRISFCEISVLQNIIAVMHSMHKFSKGMLGVRFFFSAKRIVENSFGYSLGLIINTCVIWGGLNYKYPK